MGLLRVPLSRGKDLMLKGYVSTETAFFYAQIFLKLRLEKFGHKKRLHIREAFYNG
jgi:hypothetical protein